MKKFVVIITAALALSACHYGKQEAGTSIERNKEYKEKVAEQGPEINPDYVKSNGGAATTVATADTTKPATEEAPAAPATH